MEAAGGGRVLVFRAALTTSGVPREWGAGDDRPGASQLPEAPTDSLRQVTRRIATARRPGDRVILKMSPFSIRRLRLNRASDEEGRSLAELPDARGPALGDGGAGRARRELVFAQGRKVLAGALFDAMKAALPPRAGREAPICASKQDR
jgi:hypothetical protein